MAGDAATNVAGRVRPSEEALASMDAPAEDNTWHDTPDLSKANIKQQLQSTYKPGANRSGAAADPADSAAAAEDAVAEASDVAKAKAQEQRAKTKEYLRKKVPEERRDQIIWRLKVRDSTQTSRLSGGGMS
jgi:hypothetical protein